MNDGYQRYILYVEIEIKNKTVIANRVDFLGGGLQENSIHHSIQNFIRISDMLPPFLDNS